MKLLNYIYTLLIAVLLGFFSFACSDDDVEQTEGEESADVYGGDPITTTVKVCVSAPDVSVDIESATRSSDNANIEYAQPENGGRFQNIVVVVTDNSDKVYAIHCNKWYDGAPTSTGVKQYEVIFPDLKINATTGKVYALGNVSTDVYNTISGYAVSGATAMSNYAELNNLIKTSNISVTPANLYKLSFKPQAGNFKVGSTDVTTACSGMPVNAMATATIQKGATIFNVHMKRVCARLQVTFRNFTGQYIDYNDNTPQNNNVYVDQFTINRVLATSSKYFYYDGSAPSNTGSEPFNILDALGGTNDHVINKIENGKDITISMYVFENKKGNNSTDYQYNLKVDRGKSLGKKTTKLEYDNAYVIWNNVYKYAITSNGTSVEVTTQNHSDIVPFDSQVFWKLEKPTNDNSSVSDDYMLRQLILDSNEKIREGKYFRHQENDISSSQADLYDVNSSLTDNKSDIQYVQFNLSENHSDDTQSYYTMILLNSKFGTIKLWGFLGGSIPYENGYNYWSKRNFIFSSEEPAYVYLTINNNNLKREVSPRGIGADGLKYEWTLYAKYIIKDKQPLKDITKIERNHSYELEFKVMPNYDTKQELIVNCVRKQNEISWEEIQK